MKRLLQSTVDKSLCSTCAALNITRILRNGCSDKDMIYLGYLVEIIHKANQCRFCNLVGSLFRRRWCLDTLPDVDLSSVVCSLYAVSIGALADPDVRDKKRCHRLFVHASNRPREITDILNRTNMDFRLDIQLLEEDARKVRRGRELHGRRMTEMVDIALVKRWFTLCERGHGDACASVWWRASEAPLPRFVRVVDTTAMSLVPAPSDCRYIALSYVWGTAGDSYWTTGANIHSRLQPAGLDLSSLPATIADAIYVVRALGERYLWVDMLCIIQDSSEDKGEQIHAMDLVYSKATLTIFAADGDSVHARLPGISPGSRTLHQHIETIQGLHLALPFPSLRDAVMQSTWDTRGWTLQELFISRRRLIFTAYQAYFECGKDIWCEDLIAESKSKKYSDHPMRYAGSGAHTFLYRLESQDPDYMSSYVRLVERYTQRRLSHPSDVLFAITALTNTMTRAYQLAEGDPSQAFRYGMQVWNLEQSLLWQPRLDSEHARRVDDEGCALWPSWSWAGWVGAVVHSSINQFVTTVLVTTPQVKPAESLVRGWYLVDADRLVRLDVERIWFSRAGNEAWRYVVPDDVEVYALGALPPSGTLVFRTQCAFLRCRLALVAPPAPHAIFEIVSDGASMGRMILRSTTPSPSVLECVVVARCGGMLGLHDEVRYGSYYRMLYVMAVRRVGDVAGTQVRERVGVGVIAELAWLECDATIQTVFLR